MVIIIYTIYTYILYMYMHIYIYIPICVLYFPIRTRGFPLVIFLFEDVVTFGSSATGFKSVGSDVDVACPGDVLLETGKTSPWNITI